MQKNHHTDRDKRLLRLNRERRALLILRRQKVKIDPPVQRGWVRRWRLTQRSQLRQDAAVLSTLLSALNSERFFWRRNFRRGKHARRRWKETSQELRVLHEWEWVRLGWPEIWKERYFRLHMTTGWGGRWAVTYSFIREDCFELYTDRHFITELPLLQPEVESRLEEIEAAIGFDGQNRLNHLTGGRYRHGPDDRQRYRERFDRRRIRLALLGDWEAERARTNTPFSLSLPSSTCFLPA